jgi:hypothetical protein
MDKLFIFIRIISLSAGEASLFTPASQPRGPLLIAFAQQNLAAQIGNNGGPAFTFDASRVFSAASGCFSCSWTRKTHIDNRFQVIIRRGRQPLLQLLFSVRQIVLSTNCCASSREANAP